MQHDPRMEIVFFNFISRRMITLRRMVTLNSFQGLFAFRISIQF